jgi:hypothetical protein
MRLAKAKASFSLFASTDELSLLAGALVWPDTDKTPAA